MRHDKIPRTAAAVLWLSGIQYFVVQVIVARAWGGHPAYSISHNTISDLGNTACGQYQGLGVCSPLHAVMNASLLVLGLTQLTGALLFFGRIHSRPTHLGLIGVMLAGFGTMLVGVFPENTISLVHVLAAGLPFVLGNMALLLLDTEQDIQKTLGRWAYAPGIAALVALAFYVSGIYLGLGIGGLERVIAYPQTLWLIAYGASQIPHKGRGASG